MKDTFGNKEFDSFDENKKITELKDEIENTSGDAKKNTMTRKEFVSKVGMVLAFAPLASSVPMALSQNKKSTNETVEKKDIKNNTGNKNNVETMPPMAPSIPSPIEGVGTIVQCTGTAGNNINNLGSNNFLVGSSPDGPFSLSATIDSNGHFWTKALVVSTDNRARDVSDGVFSNYFDIEEGTPITLQKFDIEVVDGKYPLLTWTTASETNNDYFAIERSFDGELFEEIARVESKAENGTSRGPLHYDYTDETEDLHGVVYYRFTQVDKDGTEKTYMVKSVDIKREDLSPVLSPNPARSGGRVNLEIFDAKNDKYRIVNMNGQTMQEGTLSVGKNALQLTGFPQGCSSLK